eukprot:Hpha_TRINITY_DN2621_c0_g1::TRINITY_DN2621_c0_g1_i1::g.145808::m.145808
MAHTVALLLMGGVRASVFPNQTWVPSIKGRVCSSSSTPMRIELKASSGGDGVLLCSMEDGIATYTFPPGVFEMGEQILVPESTSLVGAANPNDMANPTKSPVWDDQTLFLATAGVADWNAVWCMADDMVNTRVGFVLSSRVSVRNLSFQGADTIRPNDNGALCGGGAFETKGCARNDCGNAVNNGGSDGMGSVDVTVENVRLNDYYSAEDSPKVGANIPGDYECNGVSGGCCFCKANGVRASQVGVWVPQTRNAEGTRGILVRNLVSIASQADGINLHGNVTDAFVTDTYIQNTGDDTYALWGGKLNPINVTFSRCTAVNPGVLRPNWYGNCVATYGLRSVSFLDITCKAPTLKAPLYCGGAIDIDTSMFVFYTSFGASYPADNSIRIKGWHFEDLAGGVYTPEMGHVGGYLPPSGGAPGKMGWAVAENNVTAPYYVVGNQKVNVEAFP